MIRRLEAHLATGALDYSWLVQWKERMVLVTADNYKAITTGGLLLPSLELLLLRGEMSGSITTLPLYIQYAFVKVIGFSLVESVMVCVYIDPLLCMMWLCI